MNIKKYEQQVKQPGKFENEKPIVPWLNKQVFHGFGEDIGNGYTLFSITAYINIYWSN